MSEPRLTEAELAWKDKAVQAFAEMAHNLRADDGSQLPLPVAFIGFALGYLVQLHAKIEELEAKLAEPCRRCKGCE